MRDGIADALGKRMAESRMLAQQIELVVMPSGIAQQQQPDRIGNQRRRFALSHRLARHGECFNEKFSCLGLPHYLIKTFADAKIVPAERLHGAVDQLFAAGGEPTNMAHLPTRGLG